MAWISVSEDIVGGPKIRNTAKELGCSKNEVLGLLGRLWLWAIPKTDISGRMPGTDKNDVEEVLCVGKADFLNAKHIVESLIRNNWIEFREDGLYFHEWEELQCHYYRAEAKRAADAERKRKERKNKSAGGLSKTKDKPIDEYSEEFEDFWKVYPRKKEKRGAYAKYRARLNDGWSPSQLKLAAKNYAVDVLKNKTKEKYIKHASTFLSDKTPFMDYLPKDQRLEEKPQSDNPFEDWSRGWEQQMKEQQ